MDQKLLLRTAALGAIAGMRSMSAPAILSQALQNQDVSEIPFPFDLIATSEIGNLTKLAAVGELVFDKLPFTPARTEAGPLLGRVGMGAITGAILAQSTKESPITGGIVGGIAALVATFVLYYVRRWTATGLKVADPAVALVEDGLVALAGWYLLKNDAEVLVTE